MKKGKILFSILLLSIAVAACSTDDVINKSLSGESRYVTIEFGHNSFEDVDITTRTTSDGIFEWNIQNLYVLIFKIGTNDSDSPKVYGKYFDIKNRKTDEADVINDPTDPSNIEECWWVENATIEKDANNKEVIDENGYKKTASITHGAVRIKTTTGPAGTKFKIYLIANLDAAYLQLSPEMFDGFQNEKEFNDFTLKLLGTPNHRTGMMMIGMEANVSITANANNPILAYIKDEDSNELVYSETPGASTALELKRMDAKVEVRIHINSAQNPNLKEFVPSKWQVFNIPKTAKLCEEEASNYHPAAADADGEENYFDTLPLNFERTVDVEVKNEGGNVTKTVSDNIFSFYMLENHPDITGRGVATTYHDRDMRNKNADGTYATTGDKWKYAPELGTYLKISGQLKMVADTNEITGKPRTLFANVAYYVHLGNFKNDVNNFNIERNNRYTYNISIFDVEKIKTEVESTATSEPFGEEESGATGDVYVAKEKVAIFDAHYGQDVLRFDSEYINDDLTWYVKTPFGEGSPKFEGINVSNDLDYKWVHFFRNKVNGTEYSHNNRWYPGNDFEPTSGHTGDRLMYIDEFIEYIRKQKRKLDAGEENDFKEEIITVGGETKTRHVIYVTAFIDEYNYEKHPISGEDDPYLWTKFVNECGDRVMHILCDYSTSKDKESSITGSVITIRQFPIQTPYTNVHKQNENGEPLTVWGCETIDESGFDYETNSGGMDFKPDGFNSDTDEDNGLYNTKVICDLETNGYNWDTYFDVTGNDLDPGSPSTTGWELPESYDPNIGGTLKNNVHFLKLNYRNLRYAFLLRNRDNDGDGEIDHEKNNNEIRWYIASLNQLTLLYLGDKGISGDAQIYPQKLANLGGNNWRHHIVSSTVAGSNLRPQMLWGEEGVSISDCDQEYGKEAPTKSIKCIRNLGLPKEKFDPENVDSHPDALVVYKKTGNIHYFDCSRIAKVSLRGGGEIDPDVENLGATDENSRYALLPLGFEIDAAQIKAVDSWLTQAQVTEYENKVREYDKAHFPDAASPVEKYDILKYIIDNYVETDYPCPDGYRLPNIREAALIAQFNLDFGDRYFITSTYYSFAFYGLKKAGEEINRSWFIKPRFITVNGSYDDIRCVRDWQPEP